MLYDCHGRRITRRKQYGLTRGPAEWVLDPLIKPTADELVDAIGGDRIDAPADDADDDEGPLTIT